MAPFGAPVSPRCLHPSFTPPKRAAWGRPPGSTGSEPILEEDKLSGPGGSVCRLLFRILPQGSCFVLGFVGRKVTVSDPLMLSTVKLDVHLSILLIIFYAPSPCKPVWKIRDFFKHRLIKCVLTSVLACCHAKRKCLGASRTV